ncbi:MAG TPA: nuclease-related domain-containing protein [Symbiobacteriaceae bacterium]|nr:nuclease-related domain-containing protein [Symbiobacteriaceae bacterium]
MVAVVTLHTPGKEDRSIAVTIKPVRPAARRRTWQLLTIATLVLGVVTVLLLAPTPSARWASLALLPVAGWCCFVWVRRSTRSRARRSIGIRLQRLPDDFYLLNDVRIPAPWGETQIDQIVISRFGLVVIGAGPRAGWMPEQVEAVRTLLFTYGIVQPSVPVRPLILLPPGAPPPKRLQYGVPTLRVEHLRLHHLAPSREAILTDPQVATIAQCLLQARAAG